MIRLGPSKIAGKLLLSLVLGPRTARENTLLRLARESEMRSPGNYPRCEMGKLLGNSGRFGLGLKVGEGTSNPSSIGL